MVTVFRAYGLHIVIFVDDHRPAHVHVFGDGQAKIDLLGAGGEPALVWSEGIAKDRGPPGDADSDGAASPAAPAMGAYPWPT